MCKRCVSKPGRLLGLGRTGLGTGSAVVAIFIPKCPLCVAAWAWALSTVGVGFNRWDSIRWPLTAAFLVLAALLLGFRANPWVKAIVLLGTGLCLSFKIAEGSTSFGLDMALGTTASASYAITYLMICQYRIAKLVVPVSGA